MMLLVIFSAVGPLLYNLGQRYLGSFSAASLYGIGLPLLLLIPALFSGNPQDRIVQDSLEKTS